MRSTSPNCFRVTGHNPRMHHGGHPKTWTFQSLSLKQPRTRQLLATNRLKILPLYLLRLLSSLAKGISNSRLMSSCVKSTVNASWLWYLIPVTRQYSQHRLPPYGEQSRLNGTLFYLLTVCFHNEIFPLVLSVKCPVQAANSSDSKDTLHKLPVRAPSLAPS